MPRVRSTSAWQLELLMQLVEQEPRLFRGKPLNGLESRHFWEKAADQLNICDIGVKKAPDQWKKYWIEMKYRSKKRASELIEQNLDSKQSDKPKSLSLSETERRVLDIIHTDNPEILDSLLLPAPLSPQPQPYPSDERVNPDLSVEFQTNEQQSSDNTPSLSPEERASSFRERIKLDPKKYESFKRRELDRAKRVALLRAQLNDNQNGKRRRLLLLEKKRRQHELNEKHMKHHMPKVTVKNNTQLGIWQFDNVKQEQMVTVKRDLSNEDMDQEESSETDFPDPNSMDSRDEEQVETTLPVYYIPPRPDMPVSTSSGQDMVSTESTRASEHTEQMAREIHELQKQLLMEQIREAKAKADLAELRLKEQQAEPALP